MLSVLNLRFTVAFVMACLLIVVTTAGAQETQKKRIIVLETMTLPLVQNGTQWFRRGMSELGLQDGGDVEYVVLNADGNLDRAGKLLTEELSAAEPDLVVTIATLASRAARGIMKTRETPQVFMYVADPIKEGFVGKIGDRSNSNITGVTHVIPAMAKLEIVASAIQSMTEARPVRVGILHSTYPSAVSDAGALTASADAKHRIEFTDLSFPYEPGEAGMSSMRAAAVTLVEQKLDAVDAIWIAVGPNENDGDFIEAIVGTGVPILYSGSLTAVEKGALLALISNGEINGRAVARVAADVLEGQFAGDIPIVRPDTFLVGVNVGQAADMGAIIPSHILELAGDHIYR